MKDKFLTRAKYSNKKSTAAKIALNTGVLVAIILRKAVFIRSKQQGIYFTLRKIRPGRVAI